MKLKLEILKKKFKPAIAVYYAHSFTAQSKERKKRLRRIENMKKYTKKFLDSNKNEGKIKEEGLLYNAQKAEKGLGIPRELWIELSDYFPKSKISKYIGDNINTAFIVGFLIGWTEKNDKIL